MTTTGKIRAFIALDLPAELSDFLGSLQKKLLAGSSGVSRVKTENIHLTLRFLGDVTGDEAKKAAEALEKIFSGVGDLKLSTGPVELKNNRVLWVAVEQNARLTRLKKDLDAELKALGFANDDKDGKRYFRAHLTLARIRTPDDARTLRSLMRGLNDTDVGFVPEAVTLYRSEFGPGGARYTALKSVRLEA